MKNKNILRILLLFIIVSNVVFCVSWMYVFNTQAQCDGMNMTREMIKWFKFRGLIRNISEAMVYILYIAYCWFARYVYKINEIKLFAQLMQKLVIILAIVGLLAIGVNHMIVSQMVGVMNFLEPVLICIGISVVNILLLLVINKRRSSKA